MEIKINEFGEIHNVFMRIFYRTIKIYELDEWCLPNPVREKNIEKCTCEVVPYFLTNLLTFVTNTALHDALQLWADDCITARMTMRLSTDDNRIEHARQVVYDAFVTLAKYLDNIVQKSRPLWIEKDDYLIHAMFAEKSCNYTGASNELRMPFVVHNGKKVMSYQRMFWYVKHHYSQINS